MDLGRFSVSLSVKDIVASREFYEKLGFTEVAGDMNQNWIVLQNGQARIGLFQGMFEGNIFTFNPIDARAIQKALKAAGIPLTVEADETTTGPAYLTFSDLDGNAFLIDQHV